MKTRRAAARGAAERGSAAVPFAIALPVMIGFIGLALDLSFIYTRKSELQQIADSMALTAARELNGTKAGLSSAVSKLTFGAGSHTYEFGRWRTGWDSGALSLASSPDAAEADWKEASTINSDAAAAGLLFARIDTSKLIGENGNMGVLETVFIKALPGVVGSINMTVRSVAGPSSVQVTPLAICALDTNASGTRANPGLAAVEKVEYGFRRGVSYNLLDINPASVTPQNYLVNPLSPGSGTNDVTNFASGRVKPFFCTGTIALPGVGAGSKVHVQPLGGLDIREWLNSRFNDYLGTDACNVATAPPDTNIREFIGGYGNWYMSNTPATYPASATSTNRNGSSRVTFADLVAGDTTTGTYGAESFGPLWTYAKAVSVTGTTYALDDWPKLYSFGSASVPVGDATKYGGAANAYLSSNHSSAPPSSTNPIANRRVLNIPLLSCAGGAPATPANVLAIARFFMTARAQNTPQPLVPGEFAGLLPVGGPTISVALYK